MWGHTEHNFIEKVTPYKDLEIFICSTSWHTVMFENYLFERKDGDDSLQNSAFKSILRQSRITIQNSMKLQEFRHCRKWLTKAKMF